MIYSVNCFTLSELWVLSTIEDNEVFEVPPSDHTYLVVVSHVSCYYCVR